MNRLLIKNLQFLKGKIYDLSKSVVIHLGSNL